MDIYYFNYTRHAAMWFVIIFLSLTYTKFITNEFEMFIPISHEWTDLHHCVIWEILGTMSSLYIYRYLWIYLGRRNFLDFQGEKQVFGLCNWPVSSYPQINAPKSVQP